MADDFTVATAGGTETIRATDLGSTGKKAQHLFAGPMRRTPVAPSEKLTVGTGAVVSLSAPGTATHALVYAEGTAGTNGVRFYEDGTSPTTGATGNGPVLDGGNWWELDTTALSSFKMIARTTTTTVHVIYHKYA